MGISKPPYSDESPFDALWSAVATVSISFSLATLLLLLLGTPNLVPSAKALADDDAKVAIAFWGMLGSGLSFLVLGWIAGAYTRSYAAPPGWSWPRYEKLEGKVRLRGIARLALALVLLIPAISLVICAIVYVKKSRVASWAAADPLAQGFWGSRIAAWNSSCVSEPCFRMAPKDMSAPFAPQWFYWSEPLLAVVALGALVAWGCFAAGRKR